MTNNVNVLAPFGPKIAKLKIPKNLISKMNKEIDKIVDSQNLSKKFDIVKNWLVKLVKNCNFLKILLINI